MVSKQWSIACCALLLLAGVVSATSVPQQDAPAPGDGPSLQDKIKHVVVLMLENRSFDHMIGMLKSKISEVDGCTVDDTNPGCSNPIDPTDPNSPRVHAGNGAVYIQPADPNHSVPDTTDQVYGYGDTSVFPAPMSGFIKNYAGPMGNNITGGEFIMQCFDPKHVPVITTLASDFVLFDQWHCGVPGPTEVNRAFAASGTSYGYGSNTQILDHLGMPQMPIMDTLESANKTWAVYFADAPAMIGFQWTWAHLDKYHFLDKFYDDAKAGTLPSLSWLEPAYFEFLGTPATDQHPDHDVAEGERLIKEVYEAVRSSPLWNNTLLLVTYDEHGGFFDHVSPPTNVPNPDGRVSTKPTFNFTRLGVRVPAIIASPWADMGQVIHSPSSAAYCHSSIPATLRKIFAPSAAPLTKRSAWAATFDDILTRTTPNPHCPTTMPAPPPLRNMYPTLPPLDGSLPMSHMQEGHVRMLGKLTGDEASGRLTDRVIAAMNEGEGAAYVRDAMNRFLGRQEVPLVPNSDKVLDQVFSRH